VTEGLSPAKIIRNPSRFFLLNLGQMKLKGLIQEVLTIPLHSLGCHTQLHVHSKKLGWAEGINIFPSRKQIKFKGVIFFIIKVRFGNFTSALLILHLKGRFDTFRTSYEDSIPFFWMF